jgi:aspartate/methionine/tyrosine aminotransferase
MFRKNCILIKSRVATKHIVLLDHKGVEVSLYPSGRMLIKAKTKEESIEIAKDLLRELGITVN